MESYSLPTVNGRAFMAVAHGFTGKPFFDITAATTSSCGHSSHQQSHSEPTRPEGSISFCWPRTSAYIQPTSPTLSEVDCAITGTTTFTDLTRASEDGYVRSNRVRPTDIRNTVDRLSKTDVRTSKGNFQNKKCQVHLQDNGAEVAASASFHIPTAVRPNDSYPLSQQQSWFSSGAQDEVPATVNAQYDYRYLPALGSFHSRSVGRLSDAQGQPGASPDADLVGFFDTEGSGQRYCNALRDRDITPTAPRTRLAAARQSCFDHASHPETPGLTISAADDDCLGIGVDLGGGGANENGLGSGRKRSRQQALGPGSECEGTAMEKPRWLLRTARLPSGALVPPGRQSGGVASAEATRLPHLDSLATLGDADLAGPIMDPASAPPRKTQPGRLMACGAAGGLCDTMGSRGGPAVGSGVFLGEEDQEPQEERLAARGSSLASEPDDEPDWGQELNLALRQDIPLCLQRRRDHQRGVEPHCSAALVRLQQLRQQLQQQQANKQQEPLSLEHEHEQQNRQQESLIGNENQECQAASATAARVSLSEGERSPAAAAATPAARGPTTSSSQGPPACEQAGAPPWRGTSEDASNESNMRHLRGGTSLPKSYDASCRPAGREALHEALIMLTTRYYFERGLPVKK